MAMPTTDTRPITARQTGCILPPLCSICPGPDQLLFSKPPVLGYGANDSVGFGMNDSGSKIRAAFDVPTHDFLSRRRRSATDLQFVDSSPARPLFREPFAQELQTSNSGLSGMTCGAPSFGPVLQDRERPWVPPKMPPFRAESPSLPRAWRAQKPFPGSAPSSSSSGSTPPDERLSWQQGSVSGSNTSRSGSADSPEGESWTGASSFGRPNQTSSSEFSGPSYSIPWAGSCHIQPRDYPSEDRSPDSGSGSGSGCGSSKSSSTTVRKSTNPSTKRADGSTRVRVAWSPEEDMHMAKMVQLLGKCWTAISMTFPNRTRDQCRDRWRKFTDASRSHSRRSSKQGARKDHSEPSAQS
mmetsp:Transcript_21839/g.51280  ORF Transcript_21839/g.51280 Transcript_21839/m.51280 type:complete len:354 (+) Transcript_21839:28-1089(+)